LLRILQIHKIILIRHVGYVRRVQLISIKFRIFLENIKKINVNLPEGANGLPGDKLVAKTNPKVDGKMLKIGNRKTETEKN